MEQNRTIKAGGKEYILYAVRGYVANVEKIVKTHVYRGNQSVSSSNSVDTQIHLIDNNGREHSFQLSDWDIACRDGNELTIAWVLPKGMKSSNIGMRRYVLIINHTTDLKWDYTEKICARGLPRVSFAIIGIFFLFGGFIGFFGNFFLNTIADAILNAILYGIGFALLGLIPGLIIGLIIVKSQFNNELKRVKSEISKGVIEIV